MPIKIKDTQNKKQGYFNAKAKKIDLSIGGNCSVVLHEKEAAKYGITILDKVTIFFKDKKTGKPRKASVNAELTNELVKPGHIGIMKDTHEKYKINHGDIIGVEYTKHSDKSVLAIKKKLQGKKLSKSEVKAIIKDISENKLSKTMITYYVAASFLNENDMDELFWSTKYSAQYGEKLDFGASMGKIIADKHCIGGVPGNETTMVIIPIIASLGITIPKTFSKAITSPAATGECVEVLTKIKNSKLEILDTVKHTGACLSRGGGLALAPANNEIMNVTYPISMEPISKMVSSIMAKKYAMGVTHCLIDIPIGPTAKISTQDEAEELGDMFKYLGERLGMKMKISYTDGSQPVGRGVGAVLQVKEVLEILQQKSGRSLALQEKIIELSAQIIMLVQHTNYNTARELANHQLKSGAAREKFVEIMNYQNKDTDKYKNKYFDGKFEELFPEKLQLGKYQQKIYAENNVIIKSVDMKKLNEIARNLGCPQEYQAGIWLPHKIGETVEKGEELFSIYANDSFKFEQTLKKLETESFYEFE